MGWFLYYIALTIGWTAFLTFDIDNGTGTGWVAFDALMLVASVFCLVTLYNEK